MANEKWNLSDHSLQRNFYLFNDGLNRVQTSARQSIITIEEIEKRLKLQEKDKAAAPSFPTPPSFQRKRESR